MSIAQAECVEGGDPRHAGRCYRCDKPVAREPKLDPRTAPDPVFIRQFLRGAERVAGLDLGWSDDVFDRIQALNAVHGERYRTYSLRQMLREISEEDQDLGGWPVLAALVVNGMDDLDADVALEIKQLLQQVSAYAVRQEGLVERIRVLLD